MLVGIDIDGTADANPPLYLSLMQALRAAGHRVVILTGSSSEKVEPQDTLDKAEYLAKLGLGEAYDQLVVFADPTAEAKAQWLRENKADMLIDNSKENARAAPCLVLVPWQTRING